MDKLLTEYGLEFKENSEARNAEITIKEKVIKSHYRLLKAKEALRFHELETLEDYELNRK